MNLNGSHLFHYRRVQVLPLKIESKLLYSQSLQEKFKLTNTTHSLTLKKSGFLGQVQWKYLAWSQGSFSMKTFCLFLDLNLEILYREMFTLLRG